MDQRKTKWIAIALVSAVAFLLLTLAAGCSGLPRSRHKEPPSEGIVCLTKQNQYPEGTEGIAIQVENRGEYQGEINRPYLEVKHSDRWYILPKNTQELEPANLLYVYPGEPQAWEIYLGVYDLAPEEYRAVFDYRNSEGYFAYPFELTAEQ